MNNIYFIIYNPNLMSFAIFDQMKIFQNCIVHLILILKAPYYYIWKLKQLVFTIIQYMEAKQNQQSNAKYIALFNQTIKDLDAYYNDRTKIGVWNTIFYSISLYLTKDGPLSPEAQQIINFYLSNKIQGSLHAQIVNQHKQLICKIFEFSMTGSESIDDSLSTGMLSQVVYKRLFKAESESSIVVKFLQYCIQAVSLHFCQFLSKFKLAKGFHIFLTNRLIPKIIKRKSHNCYSNQQFMNSIFGQNVVLLQGYLDNVKPILSNYLNIQNLFEVTSKLFKDKKAFLTGYAVQNQKSTNKLQYNSKKVNLNTIFDSSYAGRQMIQKKLSEISFSDLQQTNKNYKWSLLSCITQFQFSLQCIFQKLPIFLKPFSNGDILSYLRRKFFPTFIYQVMKSGYIEGPFLSEFVEVIVNVGKNPFQVICFQRTNEIEQIIAKYEHQNIWNCIQKLNVRYSKIKVHSKSIAVIPNNNYYLLAGDMSPKSIDTLSQIIRWVVLPKHITTISNCIKVLESKKKMYKHYYFLPIQFTLLQFASHQYFKLQNPQIVKIINNYVFNKLLQEQKILCELIKITSNNNPKQSNIPYIQRFCFSCYLPIFNYFCLTQRNQAVCMNCRLNDNDFAKCQQICLIYHPNDLRDSLIMANIFVQKHRLPGKSIQHKYEKYVCQSKFVGAFENQSCQAIFTQESVNISNCPINIAKSDEMFFANKSKQMKVVTAQQTLISLALSKAPANEEEKKILLQKISCYIKSISDPEELKKNICSKYDISNNVMTVLNAFISKMV